jgi:hypothetical protein
LQAAIGLETIPLGAVLEEAEPEEQQHFLAKVPLPGRVWWRLLGRRRDRAQVTELGGR